MPKISLLKKSSTSLTGTTGTKCSLLRKPVKPVPLPDPLANVEYTGDLAEDGARELTALDEAFKDNARLERRKHAQAIDSEFWVALCFESRAQKEAFLQAVGLLAQGDKYLDGKALARSLGIELLAETPPHRERGIDPKLAELAM